MIPSDWKSIAIGGVVLLVIWLIDLIICLKVCSCMARNRNRNRALWKWLGFCFGWVAVLVLACLPVEDLGDYANISQPKQPRQPKKMQRQYCRCGYCGTVTDEPICPGCGGYLQY